MANKLALLAYAVQQADTSRTALLKFTVSAALAFHEANVVDGNKAGDEVKKALKKALRDRGEDRKTADRVVNNACKMGAPLAEKLGPDMGLTVAETVDNILEHLALNGVKNVAGMAVYLGTAKPEKEKAEKGADLAATLGAMADAGNPGGEGMGDMSKPAEPADMSQNEAFTPASLDLTALTDAQLAMLAEMVAAEMTARAKRAAIAA